MLKLLTDLIFIITAFFPAGYSGLIGIITSPFIHANFNHLINNTVPFFFLLTAIFYFYQKVAWRVLMISYLVTGSWYGLLPVHLIMSEPAD